MASGALTLLLVVGSCYSPAIAVGLPCSESDLCPGGLSCAADGICRPANEPVPECELAHALLTGGSEADDRALAAMTDARCNLYVCGALGGAAVLGDCAGCALESAGEDDGFVVKYSAKGRAEWALGFGGAGADACSALAVTPAGDVFLGGAFSGEALLLRDSLLLGSGSADSTAFAARLTSHGEVAWAKTLSAGGFGVLEHVRALALGADALFVAADKGGASALYGTSLLGTDDRAVALEGSLGSHVAANAVAVSADGVFAALTIDAAPALPAPCDGVLLAGQPTAGLVLKWDVALTECRWAITLLSDDGATTATALALSDPNRVFVGGSTEGALDFGMALGAPPAALADAYLARLDDGAVPSPRWQRTSGAAESDETVALAAGDSELFEVTKVETPTGALALYRVDAEGQLHGVASAVASGGIHASAFALGANPAHVVLAGRFAGTLSLTGRSQAAVGAGDYFVLTGAAAAVAALLEP